MPSIDTITVLSIPRTGTNHLFYLLQKVPQLDVRFEVFHPEEAFGVSSAEVAALAARIGIRFTSNRDPRFIDWATTAPGELLDCISASSAATGRVLVFKVFPGHVDDRRLNDAILQRAHNGVLIIQRRPIDSFISLLKSSASGVYHGQDTTRLQVKASGTYFRHWWDTNHAWYRMLCEGVKTLGVPCIYLTYEDDIVGDESQVVDRLLTRLAGFGIHATLPGKTRLQGLAKQDQETRYHHKVVNWEQFRSELAKDGYLERAFDYFVEIPR